MIDANEDVRNLGVVNGNPMVQIAISRQPNANVVETVARIKALMPAFQAQLPPDRPFQDRPATAPITTQASLRDAQRTVGDLRFASGAGGVLLPAQRLVRLLIPSVSVLYRSSPTFGAMYLLGFTLDNLSLMALTIATGFVVDDAIVVIENITRHIENGMKPEAGRPQRERRRSASRCSP